MYSNTDEAFGKLIEAVASTPTPKKQSSNLKLNKKTREDLKMYAEKYGISQAAFVTILIARHRKGADEKGFKEELENALQYL